MVVTPTALSEGSRPRLLTALTGGGFTFETSVLLRDLAADFDLVFLRTEWGGVPGQDGLPAGRSYDVPPFESVTRPSRRQSALAFVQTFRRTLQVLRAENIAVVAVVGCSHAVPMLLASRLRRVRSVFIESITRFDRLSNTGRLVLRLGLASRCVVQWPALQAAHPGTELGTIL
jgi:hypothetical protein